MIDRILAGARVLIAEDDPILAFDMMSFLRAAGAGISGPAANLKRALTLAGDEALTCGILDVSLGREFSFPAAQVLRERSVGIVFYTGYADLTGLKRDWPEAQILSKPAPARFLLQTVSAACCANGSHSGAH
ncbi:MAG: response regulator [Rhodomicrobium sp.]